MARLVEVIEGDGHAAEGGTDSPKRWVEELYALDGTLIAWRDTFTNKCYYEPPKSWGRKE